ncbi:MAG: hypothetical protein QXM16_00300 [Nitrososphaerota archaeon]
MDTIPVELTDEFVEVLRRGVRVFYVRRLTLFRLMYQKLGIKTKSAKNDVKVLMALESKWFREVDEDFLVFRKLISGYRSLLKSYVSLTNRMKALNGSERDVLRVAVDVLEKQLNAMAKIIVDEAGRRIPAYDEVVDTLGIGGDYHLMAREALAEIMPYVERTRSFSRLKNFFGLFKARKGVNKIYSKKARQALSRLTTAALKNTHHRARDEERILRMIWKTVKETRERLEAPA